MSEPLNKRFKIDTKEQPSHKDLLQPQMSDSTTSSVDAIVHDNASEVNPGVIPNTIMSNSSIKVNASFSNNAILTTDTQSKLAAMTTFSGKFSEHILGMHEPLNGFTPIKNIRKYFDIIPLPTMFPKSGVFVMDSDFKISTNMPDAIKYVEQYLAKGNQDIPLMALPISIIIGLLKLVSAIRTVPVDLPKFPNQTQAGSFLVDGANITGIADFNTATPAFTHEDWNIAMRELLSEGDYDYETADGPYNLMTGIVRRARCLHFNINSTISNLGFSEYEAKLLQRAEMATLLSDGLNNPFANTVEHAVVNGFQLSTAQDNSYAGAAIYAFRHLRTAVVDRVMEDVTALVPNPFSMITSDASNNIAVANTNDKTMITSQMSRYTAMDTATIFTKYMTGLCNAKLTMLDLSVPAFSDLSWSSFIESVFTLLFIPRNCLNPVTRTFLENKIAFMFVKGRETNNAPHSRFFRIVPQAPPWHPQILNPAMYSGQTLGNRCANYNGSGAEGEVELNLAAFFSYDVFTEYTVRNAAITQEAGGVANPPPVLVNRAYGTWSTNQTKMHNISLHSDSSEGSSAYRCIKGARYILQYIAANAPAYITSMFGGNFKPNVLSAMANQAIDTLIRNAKVFTHNVNVFYRAACHLPLSTTSNFTDDPPLLMSPALANFNRNTTKVEDPILVYLNIADCYAMLLSSKMQIAHVRTGDLFSAMIHHHAIICDLAIYELIRRSLTTLINSGRLYTDQIRSNQLIHHMITKYVPFRFLSPDFLDKVYPSRALETDTPINGVIPAPTVANDTSFFHFIRSLLTSREDAAIIEYMGNNLGIATKCEESAEQEILFKYYHVATWDEYYQYDDRGKVALRPAEDYVTCTWVGNQGGDNENPGEIPLVSEGNQRNLRSLAPGTRYFIPRNVTREMISSGALGWYLYILPLDGALILIEWPCFYDLSLISTKTIPQFLPTSIPTHISLNATFKLEAGLLSFDPAQRFFNPPLPQRWVPCIREPNHISRLIFDEDEIDRVGTVVNWYSSLPGMNAWNVFADSGNLY